MHEACDKDFVGKLPTTTGWQPVLPKQEWRKRMTKAVGISPARSS